MTKIRIQILTILITLISIATGCGDDGVVTILSTEDQLALDIVKINEYIDAKGYTNVDTTSLGVRFVVTNEGSGDSIESGDIISLHYTGRLTDDFVFDTSIDTAAVNHDLYDSLSTYPPFIFTHSESGWALRTGYSFVTGFSDGVTYALRKVNVGGSARLMIPSTLAYGATARATIPANSILIFDIYPIRVRKD